MTKQTSEYGPTPSYYTLPITAIVDALGMIAGLEERNPDIPDARFKPVGNVSAENGGTAAAGDLDLDLKFR